jgi:HAD superfamily hydrolase (TIGR01509 family)
MSAAIFDMDGLLIDSEPLWQAAEIDVFSSAGVHLTIADCHHTQGFRISEVVNFWSRGQNWTSDEKVSLVLAIKESVIMKIEKEGTLLLGARHAIDLALNRAPVAIASSSPPEIIQAVLRRFNLGDVFSVVCSAEDVDLGKPHPGVFLKTAAALKCEPSTCVVFEDSLNGVIASKAARMSCIAVGPGAKVQDPRFSIADSRLSSLQEVTDEMLLHFRLGC